MLADRCMNISMGHKETVNHGVKLMRGRLDQTEEFSSSAKGCGYNRIHYSERAESLLGGRGFGAAEKHKTHHLIQRIEMQDK